VRELPALPLLARRYPLTSVPGALTSVPGAQRLQAVRERIDRALSRCDSPQEVVLVGASKRQSLANLRAAYDAGLRVFGENRVQEAETKIPELPQAEWHLIGPLQSNKAQRAVHDFAVVHSVDRLKIARALNRHAAEASKTIDCFVQINLGREQTKHGFLAEELEPAMAEIAELTHVRILGLMAIPPDSPVPEDARPWFRQLRELRDRLYDSAPARDFPGYLSMGMSRDFEIAIEEGATHVRVGTALFGARPPW